MSSISYYQALAQISDSFNVRSNIKGMVLWPSGETFKPRPGFGPISPFFLYCKNTPRPRQVQYLIHVFKNSIILFHSVVLAGLTYHDKNNCHFWKPLSHSVLLPHLLSDSHLHCETWDCTPFTSLPASKQQRSWLKDSYRRLSCSSLHQLAPPCMNSHVSLSLAPGSWAPTTTPPCLNEHVHENLPQVRYSIPTAVGKLGRSTVDTSSISFEKLLEESYDLSQLKGTSFPSLSLSAIWYNYEATPPSVNIK